MVEGGGTPLIPNPNQTLEQERRPLADGTLLRGGCVRVPDRHAEVHHPQPHTLHPIRCTLHPTPYTLHPTPYTLHPTPYTLHPTLTPSTPRMILGSKFPEAAVRLTS